MDDIHESGKNDPIASVADGRIHVPMADTEYNRKKQQESMDARVREITANIARAEASLVKGEAKSLIAMMDIIENVIKVCGGESKVVFLEVTSALIRISTRVPVTANLFQFLPEGDNNPRFHKVVTKILLLSPSVSGVRWVPAEGSAMLLIGLYDFKGA